MRIIIIEIIILIGSLLGGIAYLTLVERKVMGGIQRRIGPNKVGIYGLLQPFADGIKLILKETVLPTTTNREIFVIAPIITLILSIIGWGVIPFGPGLNIIDMKMGILYVLAISSLGVFGVLFAGWSANSKYPLLGSIRSTAQLISYEVAIGLIILTPVIISGSYNLIKIIETQEGIWNIIPLLPLSIMWIISALAETNRAPFDLPEAESELVAGFMTEHSALPFVFFFLAEYGSIIFISTITVIIFLGGYIIPFITNSNSIIIEIIQPIILGIKTTIILFIFVWVRASFPRLRYDQLMTLCWTGLLPLSIGWFILVPSVWIILTI